MQTDDMKATANDAEARARQIGPRIRELRKAGGLTIAELGILLNLSHSSVGHWEAGRRTPGLPELIRIADVFEIGVEELVKGL